VNLLWLLVFLMLSGGDMSQILQPTKPKPEPEPGPTPKPPPSPAAPKPPPITKKPSTVPVAWPQAVPKDLPAWPGGWEPDVPVPAAEVTRAYQLLPSLWKSGKPGAKTVEKTGEKWITYLAFVPSKGKRGVAAFRPKEGAAPGGGTA
jgi:hypothetical protein